jgi:hypothetical protein
MARINIEDSIYRDERFHKLSAFEGYYKALGICVAAWDLAHRWFNKHPENLIPFSVWDEKNELSLLEKYGLAERRDNGVYVKGSSTQCDYLTKRVEAGRRGGLKSQEIFSSKLKQIEQNRPSVSSSFSLSNSEELKNVFSDENTTIKVEPKFDLEILYKQYPKRQGNQRKAAGLKSLSKIIKQQTDFDDALRAVKNYKHHAITSKTEGTPMVAMFATFFGRDEIWKEWIDRSAESTTQPLAAVDFKRLAFGGG